MGDARRSTTRAPTLTARTTSRAAARAARRSPGTRTRRSGCKLPVRPRAACSSAGARRAPAAADPVAAFAEVAADGGYRGERGRGGFVRCDWEEATRADRRRDRAHDPRARARSGRRLHADPGDVAGVVRRRHALPVADRRAHDDVLRLVRGPAAGVAAGVRRPDRRARVGRLVGRELPDRLGHEPADHAHARTRTS